MAGGYVISVDPSELANRFASYEVEPLDEREEYDPEMEALFSIEDCDSLIMPLLSKIPDREADLIYLYYICKKRQADIAHMFSITQAAVSYRLDRGLKRIKFLLATPTVSEDAMRVDLASIFEQIDVDILVGMWKTTCQSEVASSLNLTQGRVRHRFFKAVEVLRLEASKDERYRSYEKIFSSISSKNFNILKSVILPQWQNRGLDRCE
jgi:hypothetical protein